MAKKKLIRQNRLGVWILKNTLTPSLQRAYNIQYVDIQEVHKLPPPYILVANHVNFWDPFWICHILPYPVPQYITSDNSFRNPLFTAVLKTTGSIPKTKFMSDAESVRHILQTIRDRRPIGIFAEGRRTWDGRSFAPMYPVSKLIQRLKLPVVRAIIKGGFLAKPRWARYRRWGQVTIQYDLLFTPELLARSTAEEIHGLLSEKLAFDELEYQRKVMIPFKGKRLAEYMERFLFVCRHCESLTGLTSQDDLLFCSDCGHTVRYNEYGFLEQVREKLYFEDPADWNTWQLEFLKQRVAEHKERQSREPIFKEEGVILWTGYKAQPLRKLMGGTAALYYDRLVVKHRQDRVFPLPKIEGITVQDREKLEFYNQNTLFRCDFLDARVSSYKWMKAVQFLQEHNPENL